MPALELCPTPLEILADESLTSFSISLFLYTLSYLSYFITCLFTVETFDQILNPLSPNIHLQILQTDVHTSPLRISWENLIKNHGIFSMMIILLILITLSLDSEWILLGENCCWTLLGLKGLKECFLFQFQYVMTLINGHSLRQVTHYSYLWWAMLCRYDIIISLCSECQAWSLLNL